MPLITANGTILSLGPSVLESVDTVAEFEALTFVTVGYVSNIGEYGDAAASVNFAVIGDGRVRKAKGARDAGTLTIVVGHEPTDLGQAALQAAEATNFNYAVKVERPDAPVAGWSNTIDYMRGLVRSKRENIGGNDNIIQATYEIDVNSKIYRDPAAAP